MTGTTVWHRWRLEIGSACFSEFSNDADRDAADRRLVRAARIGFSTPSVTEGDAEALVAQPVHVAVNGDVRSGPRDG
jgi:hypothetical protein